MKYPSMNKKYQQKKYNVTKCSNRRSGKKVKYIVIHNTGTRAPAKNNCIYFGGENRFASADYFIDKDGSIYKFNANCAKYYSWHCGDGRGQYGIFNENSIGIEVVSACEKFTDEQIASLKKLVNAIQSDYGVKDEHVVRHYDASHKLCPWYYCGNSNKDKRWRELWREITSTSKSKSNKSPKVKGKSKGDSYKVTITCESLNIRSGPGAEYSVVGNVIKGINYTIVETKDGWGKLMSGTGWICLKYTKK